MTTNPMNKSDSTYPERNNNLEYIKYIPFFPTQTKKIVSGIPSIRSIHPATTIYSTTSTRSIQPSVASGSSTLISSPTQTMIPFFTAASVPKLYNTPSFSETYNPYPTTINPENTPFPKTKDFYEASYSTVNIAYIVLGCVLALIAVACSCLFYILKKRSQKQTRVSMFTFTDKERSQEEQALVEQHCIPNSLYPPKFQVSKRHMLRSPSPMDSLLSTDQYSVSALRPLRASYLTSSSSPRSNVNSLLLKTSYISKLRDSVNSPFSDKSEAKVDPFSDWESCRSQSPNPADFSHRY
ncbi:unnamed protein product [Rhizopus stolonifer]